jgi:hypothetical protein
MDVNSTEHDDERMQAGNRVDVARDITFSRHSADIGLAIDLGRDIEISFLQFGPNVKARVVSGESESDAEGYEFGPGATEVARIRMAPPSILQMSFLFLDTLLESNKANKEKLREYMEKMFDNYPDVSEAEKR